MKSIIYAVPPEAPKEKAVPKAEGAPPGPSPRAEAFPRLLGELLPYRLTDAIRRLFAEKRFSTVEEIRLRRETAATITTDRGTLYPGIILSAREMDETLTRICGGSLYAHSETIGEGYIALPGGIRVGICGRAAVEGGRIIGVYDPTAISIRLPGRIAVSGGTIRTLLTEMRGDAGVLIYAPPGVGKTTLLRAVIREMASGRDAMRVAVIDSRGELEMSTEDKARGLTVDVLSGYPRPKGIEIAARTLNAELVVCDEIGDVSEADAIIAAQNCGVPLLATAHGQDLEGILHRTGIRRLHDAGVFGYYVGIARIPNEFSYTVQSRAEADALLYAPA